jgi:hypothetical protein
MTKVYAKIEKADYGLYEGMLQVGLGISYDKYTGTFWFLNDEEDIRYMLRSTHSEKISDLEGKVIEAYKKGSQLHGLSVGKIKKKKK